jgi:ferredoxin/flavodoxin---NADP+ reductase
MLQYLYCLFKTYLYELMVVGNKNKDLHRIINIRNLTDSAYVVRFERKNFEFRPGCYVTVGMTDNVLRREYSIYSGTSDDYLEILIKEVKDGELSKKLKKLRKGDFISVNGPFGKFNLPKFVNNKFLFIASGTGISPFHSMIASNKMLDFKLIHGVRYEHEAYEKFFYNPSKYNLCVSGEKTVNYNGRLTSLLPRLTIATDTLCFICGNSNMIFESYAILKNKGIKESNIFTEVYF